MQARKCIEIAIATLTAATLSSAAMADEMFMKFEGNACGGEILGDSTDPQHPNEIVVASYSVGVEAETSWTKGGGASVGKPSPGDFKFNMASNRALPRILNCITTGNAMPKAILSVRTDPPGNKAGFEYLRYTMEGTFFTAVDQAATGPGRGLVAISLVYKTLKVQEFVQGAPNQTQCLLWNIPSGTAGPC
jgi:type VI secretion system secreted protein Hcp